MSIVETVVSDMECKPEKQSRSDPAKSVSKVTDDELLRRFILRRDEAAFGQLVSRHAPLVMSVCRRALGSEQDAEDAFQATFLVLARKAATIQSATSLSGWLYTTAHRNALQLRAERARRKEQILEVETMTATDTFDRIAGNHEQSILDEEFNRLPEKYRLPLFLCCIEGKSRDDAAEQLGLSTGAVKGRLERGRQLLRSKLAFRGLTFATTFAVFAGWRQAAQAAQVTPALNASTAQGAVQYAMGNTALGFVSQQAISLANGGSRVLPFGVGKIVACILLAITTIVGTVMMLPASAERDMQSISVVPSTPDEPDLELISLVAEVEIAIPDPTPPTADSAILAEEHSGAGKKKRCGKKKVVATTEQPSASSPAPQTRAPAREEHTS